MENMSLEKIYQNYLAQGGASSLMIEHMLTKKSFNSTNTEQLLNDFFADDYFLKSYCDACISISHSPFNESSDAVNFLVFIQDIGAQALWKYHINIGEKLERFVRSFDRLDIEAERKRLHQEITANRFAFL